MSEGAGRAEILERFSQNRLDGETVPEDLKVLLPMRDELQSRSGFRVEWENEDWAPWRMASRLEAERSHEREAEPEARADALARLQAVEKVCQHIAFIAVDARGRGLGYWRGPSSRRLANSPLVVFEPPDRFRVCFASTFAEAVLEQLYGDARFKRLRAWYRSLGISIGWDDPGQLTVPYVKPSPRAMYKELFNRFRTGGPARG